MSDTLFSTMTLSERLRHYANGCSNLENYTQGALLDFAERVHVLETNLDAAKAEAAQWKREAAAFRAWSENDWCLEKRGGPAVYRYVCCDDYGNDLAEGPTPLEAVEAAMAGQAKPVADLKVKTGAEY